MYYINDSITSITTKWLSQLLQKVEANELWSCGEAKNLENLKFSKKIKYVVQIYWTHVRSVRPPVPCGRPGYQQSWWAMSPYT